MPSKKRRDVTMSFSLIVAIFIIVFFAYIIFVQYGSEFDRFSTNSFSGKENLENKWQTCVDEKTGEGFNIEYSKDVCYLNALGLSVSLEECNKILNVDLKDFCYVRISIRDEDFSVCSKVSSNKLSNCYLAVALKKGDVSVCEQIDSTEERDNCKRLVEESIN